MIEDDEIPVVRARLEALYRRFNSRKWVHPDPLEFLYEYPDPRDREIVAFVASSLAYGRVARILTSVGLVLDRMRPTPARFVRDADAGTLTALFGGFKHRFTTGDELTAMLLGIKHVTDRYGSLYGCFMEGYEQRHDTVIPALSFLVERLSICCGAGCNSLLAHPKRGSACKRLHLFLRWMVRCDRVDPGGWRGVCPSKLIVPLDTHMHRISRRMNMTGRKSAGAETALEVTRGFRRIAPHDPVRYDFGLTRFGIRDDIAVDDGDFF